MELWDLYDENRRPLGRTAVRGKPLEPGTYHITVEIWTVNSERRLLLTLRDPDKEEYPNLWECTGGSVLAGEGSREGAAREVFEETGIIAEPSELIPLYSQIKNDCICDSYLLKKDLPPESIRLQPGETADFRFVSLPMLDEMLDAGLIARPVANSLLLVREQLERYL